MPLAEAQTPAPQPLPPIVVNGRKIQGLCYTAVCGLALQDAQLKADARFMKMLQSRPGGVNENAGPPDLTKEQICAAIKSKQPPGCTTKPSIAGLNGSANGCGSGTWSRIFGTVFLAGRYIPVFTGNIDAPLSGVSFLNACNTHDICYAAQSGQGNCDNNFNSDMLAVCGAATFVSTCIDMANDYSNAVKFGGGDAYATSAKELACYKYQKELDDNGCAK